MLRNVVRGLSSTTRRRFFHSTAHATRVIERSETGKCFVMESGRGSGRRLGERNKRLLIGDKREGAVVIYNSKLTIQQVIT